MDNGLAALVQSAIGTGAPNNPSSRYYGSGVEQMTLPDGTVVSYLSRRIIPQIDDLGPRRRTTVLWRGTGSTIWPRGTSAIRFCSG